VHGDLGGDTVKRKELTPGWYIRSNGRPFTRDELKKLSRIRSLKTPDGQQPGEAHKAWFARVLEVIEAEEAKRMHAAEQHALAMAERRARVVETQAALRREMKTSKGVGEST
jgi:hypothetical protein